MSGSISSEGIWCG